jgi:CHAP domain
MKLADKLVSLARNEIGVEEVDGSNCGVRVDTYKSATNLPPHEAWPWCAAFVCWLVREAFRTDGPYTFARPTTAGAWDFENWSKKQDNSTHTLRNPGNDIKAGDIVIFKFSHIGICVRGAEAGRIRTVEGNTDAAGSREGGGVFEKSRALDSIKTRIRFTV